LPWGTDSSWNQFQQFDKSFGDILVDKPITQNVGLWRGALLRDYANLFPVVIAVINGVFAAVAANFPFKTHGRKIWFIAIVLLFSFAAVGADIHSQRLINADRVAERTRTIKIRETLGSFMVDADQLLHRLTAAVADADVWTEPVGAFLINGLGPSYLARFSNSSGTPTVSPGAVMTDETRNYWVHVNQRLARIEQFSEELHN
jgi:hypothetical protein